MIKLDTVPDLQFPTYINCPVESMLMLLGPEPLARGTVPKEDKDPVLESIEYMETVSSR